LCVQVRRLLSRGDVDVVTCDVTQVLVPDIGAIDALARLQLTARRLGGHIRVRAANTDLRRLLRLAGVEGIVGCSDEAARSGG
jgi:ABC-type transporter Mla MlaB component